MKKSGIELLRVIACLMIVLHHITFVEGIESSDMYVRLWGQFFFIGGKVGVNCFVLITGYFLSSKDLSLENCISRITKIHTKVISYCLIGLLVAVVNNLISPNVLLKSLFPVIFNTYWFVTAYIGLIFISPLLNIVLNKLNKSEHATAIVLLLALISVIPTFTAQTIFNSDIAWFVFLYILSSYIRRYSLRFVEVMSCKVMPPIMWLLIWSASVVLTIGEIWIPQLREGTNFFTGMYIFPQLINSLAWFLLFLKLKINSNFINKIGSYTFAGYLIQSNIILGTIVGSLYADVFNMFPNIYYPVVIVILGIITCALSFCVDSCLSLILNQKIIKIIEIKITRWIIAILIGIKRIIMLEGEKNESKT